MPIMFTPGDIHDCNHVLDQWSVSHFIWGVIFGRLFARTAPTWFLVLTLASWEFWENAIEARIFSTYDDYVGDSFANSMGDLLVGTAGVIFARNLATPLTAWLCAALLECASMYGGFGIHSLWLGGMQAICDVRKDGLACGISYLSRLLLLAMATVVADRVRFRKARHHER